MSVQKLNKLDAEEFRRRLAGLEDVEASGAFSPEDFREIAADFVCALAVVFNRRELEPKTLWSRIGSAIESGIVEAQGGDLERFENHCLSHIKAQIAVVAASEAYGEYTADLRKMDADAKVGFVRYLSTHLYPATIFGRQRWEERKADLEKERKRLEKLALEDEANE